MAIEFYSTRGEYGAFSNFSAHPFSLDGKRWATSEHYFQAQKFPGTRHEEEIRRAKSPSMAARMGRSRKRPLRRDWESIKEQIMAQALRAKFETHPELQTLLLSTGDEKIIEDAPRDRYWGCGADGKGRNRLGHLLMELRRQLREALES